MVLRGLKSATYSQVRRRSEKKVEEKGREEKKEEEVSLNLTSFVGIFAFGNFYKHDHHCGK